MTRRVHALVAACGAISGLLCSLPARADVPAGYTGTPYLGTPWPIPGRIEFENYDDGGENVGWRVDDSTANFGPGGCGGNDHRTEMPHPEICKTNDAPSEVDTYTMGPMTGVLYPSAEMPSSLYIGYTHGADWVKLTVDVKQAGTYKLSSTWASDPGGADAIKFQISFNDVLKADVSLPGTGGYHNWVVFDDFATVQLDAGVQVLQFAPKSMHMNYDYLQFSLVLPDGSVDDGSGDTGGASGTGGSGGVGGAETAGTGGVEAGGGGGTEAGGSSGSGGTLDVAGSSAGGDAAGGSAGSASSSGGSAGEESSAAGTSAGGSSGGKKSKKSSGCSFGPGLGEAGSAAPLGLLFAAIAVARRRSARTK